jgi:hypothetical protein
MLRSISGISSATAAVIRVWSTAKFAGKGGTNTQSATKPRKKKSKGIRSREQGGHAISVA